MLSQQIHGSFRNIFAYQIQLFSPLFIIYGDRLWEQFYIHYPSVFAAKVVIQLLLLQVWVRSTRYHLGNKIGPLLRKGEAEIQKKYSRGAVNVNSKNFHLSPFYIDWRRWEIQYNVFIINRLITLQKFGCVVLHTYVWLIPKRDPAIFPFWQCLCTIQFVNRKIQLVATETNESGSH